MATDLISVIIPTYNNPEQLLRAVQSVFKQTYSPIEIIIVDDGSETPYDLLISELQSKSPFPLFYYKKENEGPGKARQFGLNQSNGAFIQYLDADDELLPNKLAQQIGIFNKHPDIVMTYGLSMLNSNQEKIHRSKNKRLVQEDLLQSVLEVRKWHTSSCLWYYPKNDFWEGLYNGEDVLHDFNVALKTKAKVYFDNKIMVNIHTVDGQNRLSNASEDIRNHKRLAHDFFTMNQLMYNRLKAANLITIPKYANPLSERMFHASMRICLLNEKHISLKLAYLALKTAKSFIKKFEIVILIIIIKLPIKNKRTLFQRFYDLRRKIHNSRIHQFRYI